MDARCQNHMVLLDKLWIVLDVAGPNMPRPNINCKLIVASCKLVLSFFGTFVVPTSRVVCVYMDSL